MGLARIIAGEIHGGVGVGRTATTADSGAHIERGVRYEHLNQQLATPTARRLHLGFALNLLSIEMNNFNLEELRCPPSSGGRTVVL